MLKSKSLTKVKQKEEINDKFFLNSTNNLFKLCFNFLIFASSVFTIYLLYKGGYFKFATFLDNVLMMTLVALLITLVIKFFMRFNNAK